jgi:hypothetical protein
MTYNYDDIKREIGPGDNVLAQLSGLALDQKRLEAEVAKAEEALAEAQAKLKQVAERDIPQLMDAAEMTSYTTKDGITIKIKETIRGSIPEATKEQAFEWLREHDHDNLIKREFNIQFNKAEEAWAKKFEADLRKRKKPLAVTVKRSIHASTLGAFVKVQLEEGVDFPMDIFGVFRQRSSKVEVKDD